MRNASENWRPRILVSFLAALLATSMGAIIGAGAADHRPAEAFGERVTAGLTPAEIVAKQRELNAWLMRELPPGALDAPIRVRLTDEEQRDLQRSVPSGPGPLRIGLVKAVGPAVGLSGLEPGQVTRPGRRVAGGVLRATDDGGFVWAVKVASEGAVGLRVRFSNVQLPADADLYIFGLNGEAYGPYQGRGPDGSGDFWSHSVRASEAVVMLRHFGPARPEDLRGLSFGIAEVGHIGPRPGARFGVTPAAPGDPFCDNPTCVFNAACFNVSAVSVAEDAVAEMEWIAGAFIYTCTGGLIADTDASTTIPYFLTAHHCISGSKNAGNMEAFFFYRAATCDAACAPQPTTRTMGSTVVVSGRDGDFTLLRLSQTPPAGTQFLGWTNTAIASSNGAALHRISHPNFGAQAYTEQRVDTGAGTCSGLPRGQFIYSRDVVGATDGGSSGSPVVNANGQVVGQLYGSCGTNVSDPCDAESNATVDGALAYYYPQVAPFLNPGGGCTPSTEVCNDSLDNDCDGFTDCADSECSGAPNCTPTCGLRGTPCTSASECCSNKCTGPAGGKTCR